MNHANHTVAASRAAIALSSAMRVVPAATGDSHDANPRRGVASIDTVCKLNSRSEHPDDEIVATSDAKFHGIADVSVCAPQGIQAWIQRRAPRLRRANDHGRASPEAVRPFHAFLLSHFGVGPCSYAEALLATTELFSPKVDAAS